MVGIEQLGRVAKAVGTRVGLVVAGAQRRLRVEDAAGGHDVDAHGEAAGDHVEAPGKAVRPARVTLAAGDHRAVAADNLAGQREMHRGRSVDALLAIAKQLIGVHGGYSAPTYQGERDSDDEQTAGATHATPPSVFFEAV